MSAPNLIPSHPENPGYLLPCAHPLHGRCLIHVGDGDPQSIERAMARCGTVPMVVDNPDVAVIRADRVNQLTVA